MIRSNSVPMRWRDMTRLSVFPVVLLLFAAGNAFGAVQYAITDLGTLGGTFSEAYGINNSGQVVGSSSTSSGGYRAFLYSSSGSMQDLGTLGGVQSLAYAINNSGEVVGTAQTSDEPYYHAFLYNGSGPLLDLGTHEEPAWPISYAFAINNSGLVVGTVGVMPGPPAILFSHPPFPTPFALKAVVYSGSGSLQDLDTLGGEFGNAALGTNDSGQVVGYSSASASGGYVPRAFLYSGSGPLQDLGTLGGSCSVARGINGSGQIVGMAQISDGSRRAFLYSAGGSMQDLGTLGGTGSYAQAINNSGQVVGWSSTSSSGTHAFTQYGSDPMRDLNELISPSSGWTLAFANAINDKGQIVGSGTNPAGQTHAFLVSPLSTITTTTGAPPNTLSNALKPVDPTVTPPSGNLKRWNGSSWQSVTSWNDPSIHTDQPTVVIAHGWYDKINDANWTASMAHILQLQNDNANILAWDWRDDALSLPGSPDLPIETDIRLNGLIGAAESARRGGERQGKLLANELQGIHISNDNLQLLGHSNGGAVVGAAASELAFGGQKVRRVTTLDVPNLSLGDIPQAAVPGMLSDGKLRSTSVNAMRYVNPNSASEVEVYYSDGYLGRLAFGFGSPLVSSTADNIFNGRIYPGLPIVFSQGVQDCDHFRIADWYREVPNRLPAEGEFVAALEWSILSSGSENWVAGNYTEQGFESKVFGTTTLALQPIITLKKLGSETFETGMNWLGKGAERVMRNIGNFAAKIFPNSDGYLWTDVSVPQDAWYLTFDLKIETPDAGDFLTLTLGDELIFYKALNAADSDFWTVDPIFIGDFAGQTDTLLFTLNHVGTGTPSLLIDNITFLAVPEPSTLILLGVAAVALFGYQWRRRKRTA